MCKSSTHELKKPSLHSESRIWLLIKRIWKIQKSGKFLTCPSPKQNHSLYSRIFREFYSTRKKISLKMRKKHTWLQETEGKRKNLWKLLFLKFSLFWKKENQVKQIHSQCTPKEHTEVFINNNNKKISQSATHCKMKQSLWITKPKSQVVHLTCNRHNSLPAFQTWYTNFGRQGNSMRL